MSFDRRSFLQGLSALGAGLAWSPAARAATPAPIRHHAATAERVIFLHMCGGPSSVDLFDPKPVLQQRSGEPAPARFFETQKFAFTKNNARLLGSRSKFARHGRVGADVSELLPHTARMVDQLTIVRSMQTDQFNHAPAQLVMNCGSASPGRPSLGSWISWALQPLTPELPPYVVMFSGARPRFGESPWTNGFLPSTHRGVKLDAVGDPLQFLTNPPQVTRPLRRDTLDLTRALHKLARPVDAGADDRQAHLELAYALQASLPAATDITKESPSTLSLYGIDGDKASFARNCLVARRLVERGSRCVYLLDADWDHHGIEDQRLDLDLPRKCRETDQGCAALIRDLDERGLLDSTLVVWGGEFGRTPFEERPGGVGRDHHPRAFTWWMAGGGFKRGHLHGATDELGWDVVEDPVSFNDLQATILHALGFDHERLSHRFSGRDFRLTDVSGRVLRELLA